MTINNTAIRTQVTGNGAQTVFNYTFEVPAPSDAELWVTQISTDATTLINPALWVMTGIGAAAGGTFTYPLTGSAITSDFKLTLVRKVPYANLTALGNQSGYYPRSVEAAIDFLAMQTQQLNARVNQAVRLPEWEGSFLTLPSKNAMKNAYLAFDGNGDPVPVVGVTPPSVTVTPYMQTLLDDTNAAAARATLGTDIYLNYTDPLTGAIQRTIASRLAERVSVKDFGAVGDGATDDSAAFVLAIASGRKVYVPPGVFLIATQHVFSGLSNFVLEGAGIDVTTIQCTSGGTYTNSMWAFSNCTWYSIVGITFDQNENTSFSATYPLLIHLQSTNFSQEDCAFIRHTYIALAVNSCSYFTVVGCYFLRTAIAHTLNYSLNITSSLSTSAKGFVGNNKMLNSGMIAAGTDIVIVNNYCDGNGYGGSIATAATSPGFWGRYTVAGNTCINNRGRDSDGFMCCGMEIGGPYSVIVNNVVHDNDGEGIRHFAYQSIVANNIVYNNGQGLDGGFLQGGIVAYYYTATYSASYSLVTGNNCFDTGPGTQTYGYAEQSSSLVNITVKDNIFAGSVAPVLLGGGALNVYDTDVWEAYTPTFAPLTGAFTTVGPKSGRFLRKGRMCFFSAVCQITTNGSAAGALIVGLPLTSSTATRVSAVGVCDLVTGQIVQGIIEVSASTVTVRANGGTYPGADGERVTISGCYPIE